MKKERIVENGYDRIGMRYQDSRQTINNTKELDEFVRLLPENARVLDVGCGTGIPVTKHLVDSGLDVIGVDMSDVMVKLASENIPRARFIKGDMTKLDLQENTFDGLVSVFAIIHVPREKHGSLFRGFHKILKPNGIIMVSLGSKEWEGIEMFHGEKMFWSHYGPDESLRIMKDSGFDIMHEWYTTYLLDTKEERHYWILARNSDL